MAMAEHSGIMDGRGGPQWVRWDASAWWQGCVPFLTFEEEGFYVRCCNYMYRTATPLPRDDKLAASLLCSDPRVYRRLKRKLVQKGKLIECQAGVINERVMSEIDRARCASLARVKGAKRATTSRQRTRATNNKLLDSLKAKIATHRGCEPHEVSDQDAMLAFNNVSSQIDYEMTQGAKVVEDFRQTSGELPPNLRKSKPVAIEEQNEKSAKKSNKNNGSLHAQRNASVTVSVTDKIKNKKERKKESSTTTSESVARASDLDGVVGWKDASAAQLRELRDLLFAAAEGAINTQAVNLEVMTEPIVWLSGGADLRQDVLPTVQTVALQKRHKGGGLISSWGYFRDAVRSRMAERKAAEKAMSEALGDTPVEKGKPKSALHAIALRKQAEADAAKGGAA